MTVHKLLNTSNQQENVVLLVQNGVEEDTARDFIKSLSKPDNSDRLTEVSANAFIRSVASLIGDGKLVSLNHAPSRSIGGNHAS